METDKEGKLCEHSQWPFRGDEVRDDSWAEGCEERRINEWGKCWEDGEKWGRSYCILWYDGTVLWPLTCNWINECVEHCAEGPTVKVPWEPFILYKGVAACVYMFLVMCIWTLLLITVSSHHGDGEQVCSDLFVIGTLYWNSDRPWFLWLKMHVRTFFTEITLTSSFSLVG